MSTKKKSKAGWVILIVALVIAFVAGGVFLLWKRTQNILSNMSLPSEATVTRGDISRTVDGAGNLTVADTIDVKVPSELSLGDLQVEAGDTIKTGDVIATVDKSSITSAIVSMQSELDQVKESLKNKTKDKLTSYQIEELEMRQSTLEARIELMLLYYKNPVIIAMQDGLVYSVGGSSPSTQNQMPDLASLADQYDVAGLMSADMDPDMEQVPVKAIDGDDGEGEGEGDDPAVPSVIDDLSSFAVTAPVTGEAPQLTVAETDQYTGNIVWLKDSQISTDTAFAPETVYTAMVVLAPKEGYAFSGDNLEDLIADLGECDASINDKGELVITKEFDATAPEGGSDPDPDITPAPGPDDGGSSAIDDIINRLIPEDFDLQEYIAQMTAAQAAAGMGGLSGLGGFDMSSLYGGSGIDVGDIASAYGGQISGRAAGYTDNTILTLANTDNVKITIMVDELDILAISEGQEATITLDALEDSEFTGTISKVNPIASASSGTAKFQVEITIPMDEHMRIGMSASASIVIYSAKDVLLLPLDCVQQRGDQMFVYRGYDDKGELNQEMNVETGISDTDYVEIVSGLNEGDSVYYIDPDNDPIMQYMEAVNGGEEEE